MNYTYCCNIRENDTLRNSFNELTRKTFGFDFADWYAAGQWTDLYEPHVLLDGDKVISNVSVNHILFEVNGKMKLFLQLGTVMTDPEYQDQGLNRYLMERVLEEYAEDVNGIYLFANDEVVNYYPRFGFRPAKEYEYYLPCTNLASIRPSVMQKVDMSDDYQSNRFYDSILFSPSPNPNDALYMNENIGLYQFWMGAGYRDSVYYLPEIEAYIVADLEEDILRIHSLIGIEEVDLLPIARAFGDSVKEIILGYTPAVKTGFSVREHKEEDSTLFIRGEELECIENEKMMFPVLSHA